MSDATVAAIGRNLAATLQRFAHDRDTTSKNEIARLHTELCAVWRDEIKEKEAQADGVPDNGPQ